MKNTFIVILATIILGGCAVSRFDTKTISIGMTKDEVIKAQGHGPVRIVAARQEEKGVVEVWEYMNWAAYGLSEYYWLYFFNGILMQWGRPGDWQQEVNKMYELNINKR